MLHSSRLGSKPGRRCQTGGLLRVASPDFHLDIVVHFVGGITIAVEPDIAASNRRVRLGDFAFGGFDIGFVFTDPELDRAIMVVVEDGGHAFLEVGVVGNLHHHIVIGAGLAVEVPEGDDKNLIGLLKIDLVRELPEAMRPRQIAIETSATAKIARKAKKLVEGVTKAA